MAKIARVEPVRVERCSGDCPFYYEAGYTPYCSKTTRKDASLAPYYKDYHNVIPDWCPLPEEKGEKKDGEV
jgi:hypothetical protein